MHGVNLKIYSSINLKNLASLQNDFNLLKLASTACKMLIMSLFPFCCPFLGHLCLENPIYAVDFSFHMLIFQFLAAFSIFEAFNRNIMPKKDFLFVQNAIHGRGLRFHDMIVRL